jgi:hypothetical protein
MDGSLLEATTEAAELCHKGKQTDRLRQSLVGPHSAVLVFLQRVAGSRQGLEETELETALEVPNPNSTLPPA